MPDSIGNRSPEAVIEAIEENLAEASISLGRTEDGVVFRGGDVTWIYTGYPLLSRVLRARFNEEEAEDRVAEISECFKQWRAPVVWVIGPTSWPPQLPEFLTESGFGNSETWTGMALELKTITVPTNASPFRVEAVSETEALRVWTTLTGEAWAGQAADAAVEIFLPENAGGDPRSCYYIAYLNDKPVARGMSYTRGEVVGIYWVAATRESKNGEAEIAIVQRALGDARSKGASVGVMPTHEATRRLAEKLNFRPYCQFKVFAWPATQTGTQVC